MARNNRRHSRMPRGLTQEAMAEMRAFRDTALDAADTMRKAANAALDRIQDPEMYKSGARWMREIYSRELRYAADWLAGRNMPNAANAMRALAPVKEVKRKRPSSRAGSTRSRRAKSRTNRKRTQSVGARVVRATGMPPARRRSRKPSRLGTR